jgi:hypothetical protein
MKPIALGLAVLACGCKAHQTESPSLQTTPVNTTQAVTVPSEQKLGVPYYPGAKGVSGGDTADLVDAQFVTGDSVDKVVSFYKGNIRDAVATGDKNETMIEFEKDGAKYSIELHRDQRQGVTLISINARK